MVHGMVGGDYFTIVLTKLFGEPFYWSLSSIKN